MMNVAKTKFSILGSARSGIAAATKIKQLGGKAFISEFKPKEEIALADELIKEFPCEFGGHTERIFDCDILIVSPGIPSNLPILQQVRQKQIEIIGEIEFAYRIKAADSKIIGVTGSNGKSTTVSLIHHILQTAGYNSVLGGNIGTAASSFPLEKPGLDFIVLELSSFQLELIKKFHSNISLILNITPDHLNRYKNMQEYAETKFKIFANQTEDDLAIMNADDAYTCGFAKKLSSRIRYFSLHQQKDVFLKNNDLISDNRKIRLQKAVLQGPHNLANMMAAVLTVKDLQITDETIEEAFSTFNPLSHRLEFVAEIAGVRYYNDSKATNTDSVKYALQSFKKPIRIILGGAGKGEDYSVLNPLLKKHAKKIYLVGSARFAMKKAFPQEIPSELFEDFESLLQKAALEAEAGDNVVLSPACTSYDMFNNFEERGDHFKRLVLDLPK